MKFFTTKMLLTLVLTGLFFGAPVDNAAWSDVPKVVSQDIAPDNPKQFIKELQRFVRSVNKERYQPEGYWEEVDDLWKSFQARKERLKDQFTKSQWSRVNSLERRFNNLRKKKTKLS